MCEFKSAIILKNKVVLAPDGNESHSDLLNKLGIDDNRMNAMKTFVRAELTPKKGDRSSAVDTWIYKVDQDIVPDWYEKDPGRYEEEFRKMVKEYMKRFKRICGFMWEPIKTDEKGTYYLLFDNFMSSTFGENNNYAESYVLDKLNNSDLAGKLKETFGDRLVPIETDLLSLDGLDDYGTVNGDILAIPTLDLYRECRKNITSLGFSWWLATPDSTPSGCGSDYVRCVNSDGGVYYYWCNFDLAVRPFFILKS